MVGTCPLPSVLPLGCAPAGSGLCSLEQADVLCPVTLLLAGHIQLGTGQRLLLPVPVRLGWALASADKQPAPKGPGAARMWGWSPLGGKGCVLVGRGWLGRSPLEPAASRHGTCCTPRPARLVLPRALAAPSPAAPQLCGVAGRVHPGCGQSQAQDGMALGSCTLGSPASTGAVACTLWGCRVPPPKAALGGGTGQFFRGQGLALLSVNLSWCHSVRAPVSAARSLPAYL